MTIKTRDARIWNKESLVDTAANISYSLAAGAVLDYCSGLRGWGIVTSRASATVMNSLTGAPYGKWRNIIFRSINTTEESSKFKKTLTDLLAFNTFQVPLYGIAIAIGSLVSEGEINFE